MVTMSEELRQLRKAAKIARQITRDLTIDELTAYIEAASKGAVMPVRATGRQWRDLIVALSAASTASDRDKSVRVTNGSVDSEPR
jgi:hypothetical protein